MLWLADHPSRALAVGVVNWLDLNVRRSLDDAAQGRDRQQAEAEIAGALGELAWRLARLDRWIDLLG